MIGIGELVLILLVAIIVVGPVKVVEMARSAGKMMGDARKAMDEGLNS